MASNTRKAKDQVEGKTPINDTRPATRNRQDNTTSITPQTTGDPANPKVDTRATNKLKEQVNENKPVNDNVQPTGVEEWDKENGYKEPAE